MLPPYIIDRSKKEDIGNQIQLEIPDYSAEYEEWIRKKQREEEQNADQTVIIIDIY